MMSIHLPIKVSEIFGPTIQGEGLLIGKPTLFVRTGGCDFRCAWCDTLFAVDSAYRETWLDLTIEEIWQKILLLSNNVPMTVSLSGGNPAIQPFAPLIEMGKARGYKFALETQGSIPKKWFSELDYLTLSPKPPSSKMSTNLATLKSCIDAAGDKVTIVLKFVVFNDTDYLFAKDFSSKFPNIQVYLQPGNHTPPDPVLKDSALDIQGIMHRMRWLIERAAADCWTSVTILPQLHVLIWGNLRGV